MPGLLLGGLAALAAGGGKLLAHLGQDHVGLLVSLLAFVSMAMIGWLVMLRLQRSLERLRGQLHELRQTDQLAHVKAPTAAVTELADAVNGVVQLAEDAIARAALEAQELQIQLKVATAERQHAQAIIYSISDAVLVTDSYDEVVLANDSAARALGFELGRERRPITQVLSDRHLIQLIGEMRQRNTSIGRQVLEHQLQTPAGQRTYKVTLSCVADRAGAPAGVVTVLHDMTRERELAQMKNDFVSSVSHELRTPLASIKAYAEMLIDGEAADPRTQQEFYEVIHNEANRLGRLIDNILNISRMESGLVKVVKKPQSLMVLTKEALEVISPQARQKQITLEEQLTPAFYQTMIDRDMVYQAVLNLLSNAVKYTPENGRITVQTIVDEAQRKVITRISDSGVGIPPKDLPYVFDKFFRSEANSRMAKGTGLGLSLVKHIIETVHHGKIFVESQVGQGSTFGFELDLND